MGQSRSVSVALSYIMKQEGKSDEEALEAIQQVRKDAKPIAAFREQLKLYFQLNYQIDPQHPEVKALRHSKTRIPRSRSKPDLNE